jgi:uncharacterized protein DUF4202
VSEGHFAEAIAAIDAANDADPRRETWEGADRGRERVYGERMTRWLERLAPDASEPLRLACRAQHLERWRIPRGDYPKDRPGYYRWRTTLARMHAERVGAILSQAGYEPVMIARVQALVRKEGLKTDPEAQRLEDVACLVFLESYFADFATEHDPDKVVDIVRKTWRKMSPAGHDAALTLELPDAAQALVARALAG